MIHQLLVHQLEFIQCCYVQDSVDIKNKYMALIHNELKSKDFHENLNLAPLLNMTKHPIK